MGINSSALLSICNLKTYFFHHNRIIKAVNGIDFNIKQNEILGIVGESGAGKSVCALSILRLLSSHVNYKITGEVIFNQVNLLKLKESEMQKIRGSQISMIFQEPGIFLNPLMSVGNQIAETIQLHHGLNYKKSWEKAIELLNLVKISEPTKKAKEFPYQLSGGMKQRVMIAMALSANPSLLIADEPTTALDTITQRQILLLIRDLQKRLSTSVLFITHNLGIIAEMADNVMVMYAGKIIEYASVNDIFYSPLHPYTLSLLKSIPSLETSRGNRLKVIPGNLPDPATEIVGCLFHPRCDYVTDICKKQEPDLIKINGNHSVRCWIFQKRAEIIG